MLTPLRFTTNINFPTNTNSTAPISTGVTKKLQPSPANIINIGFAPAGGCVVLVNNIAVTARPDASAKVKGDTPIYKVNIIPIEAVMRWPPITFFACANGLSGTPKTNTAVAPNGAISKAKPITDASKNESKAMPKNAPKPASIGKNNVFISTPNKSRPFCLHF